jgi:acyl-coenzyme A thioesterase PaaI-like protein
VQCAALDTVAGYAAATLAGPVVTLQFTTQFLSSAKGEGFAASAEVTKAGKRQLFVDASLFVVDGDDRKLVAKAAAVLARLG